MTCQQEAQNNGSSSHFIHLLLSNKILLIIELEGPHVLHEHFKTTGSEYVEKKTHTSIQLKSNKMSLNEFWAQIQEG